MNLNVYSEIGRLKAVLLHRPGRELENLTPDTLEELLFDDIPYLKIAQKEHDEFAGVLRANDVKVFYLTKMVAEAIESNDDAKEEFLTIFIDEAIDNNKYIVHRHEAKNAVRKFLEAYSSTHSMVKKSIEGIRVSELEGGEDFVQSQYLFICNPLPNLYFQRDPFISIGNGACINKMHSVTRNRETLYADIMFKYHEMFKENPVPKWYERDYENTIEGGDVLILNRDTLIIGISQRTELEGIKKLAYNIFYNKDNKFKNIIAINIGESRKYMHLDTVFTQVDIDKFSVHPDIIHGNVEIYEITKGEDDVNIEKSKSKIDVLLAKYTNQKSVKLIKCGGDDPIASAREQWNDGANTLAISPGEVIVYSRNPVTNKLLEDEGIKIHVISSAELSRGRGGPRCMSMPLIREEI
ncbi:MAG: arginine deiminase [Mycoplasmatales bacterium]